MSDQNPGPGQERVEIDDPFDVPQDVEEAWEEDADQEGEAPSG